MPWPLANLIPGLLGWRPTGDLGPWTMYTMRNGNIVWYDKAPPKEPASYRQRILRNRWRLAAAAWGNMKPETQDVWKLAAKRARLYMSGYCLWVYWSTTQDRHALRTIERQTNLTLIP